jgi:hypothetical protein
MRLILYVFTKISTVNGKWDVGNGYPTTVMPAMAYPTPHIPANA